MSLKVTGSITKILEKETGQKKDGFGEWVKQCFIVETTEQYNNVYCFEVFGQEKVDNFNQYNKTGQVVDVEFNVSVNEWKGKYFTSLSAWKIFKAEGVQAEPLQTQAEQERGHDDLPF